tara:strand:+ start:820 stop:1056 length:237 start_codon:yes stop_codon:yes gene_type:complete
MAKLTKIIDFLESFDNDLKDEVYDRECQADDQRDRNSNWEDSEKGSMYVYKTEALDELRDLIYDVVDKATKIKNKEYY